MRMPTRTQQEPGADLSLEDYIQDYLVQNKMVESASSFPQEAVDFMANTVLLYTEPRGFLATWFPPTWQVYCSGLPNVESSSDLLNFDSRLQEFILDYFLKRKLAKTAEAFAREANVSPPNASYNKCNNPAGLLSEWFSLYAPLFSTWVQHDSPFEPREYGTGECYICLKELCIKDVLKLWCDHLFHEDCILEALKVESRCPICSTSR